jgi:hypothetical protein
MGHRAKEKESPHRICCGDEGLLSRAQLEETLLGSLGRNSGGDLTQAVQQYLHILSKLPLQTCGTNEVSLK